MQWGVDGRVQLRAFSTYPSPNDRAYLSCSRLSRLRGPLITSSIPYPSTLCLLGARQEISLLQEKLRKCWRRIEPRKDRSPLAKLCATDSYGAAGARQDDRLTEKPSPFNPWLKYRDKEGEKIRHFKKHRLSRFSVVTDIVKTEDHCSKFKQAFFIQRLK